MRSEVTFVMHPDDEAEFAEFVLSEPGTVFFRGPKWNTPEPPIINSIGCAQNHLMIWNPDQTPTHKAKHYNNEHGEWWYCKTEHFTIQFLRSGFQYDEPFLFEGRIAVSTTDKSKEFIHKRSAPLIEQRFKNLRKWIRRSYANNLIIYQNIALPRSATNPCKPAASMWVGPHALDWFRQDPENRWVQQFSAITCKGSKPWRRRNSECG